MLWLLAGQRTLHAGNEDVRSRIEAGMMIRRVFASSIVALLLLAAPLAVACDLSCAFSFMESDCHAAQPESASSNMNMAGMSMPGMDMPEAPATMDQSSASSISRGHAIHPSIGDMGPCEKQACGSSALATKSPRSADPHFRVLLVATGANRTEAAPAVFRAERDEITHRFSGYGNPLRLNLRI